MTIWYFALREILKERGLKMAEARRKYGMHKKGTLLYISETGFNKLCNRPAQISIGSEDGNDVLNRLCNAMDMSPGDFFRIRK